MGIDEAGRGPVIGPMIIAAVIVKPPQLACLEELKLKDSKLIQRSKRVKLCSAIKGQVEEVRLATIPPRQIDRANINQIELKQMASFINQISPAKVYFDLPVNPAGSHSFHRYLRRLLDGQSVELIGENKADKKYPLVSAASILAKVERDKNIVKLHDKYGDFGWGYPVEKKTQEFLLRCWKEKGGFPKCVRKRWKTIKRIEHESRRRKLPLRHSNRQDV